MIKIIKDLPRQFTDLVEYLLDIRHKLNTLLNRVPQQDFETNAMALIRHQLGSIDLTDLPADKPLSPEERRAYAARVSSFYTQDLAPFVKRLIREQEAHTTETAASWDHVVMARGTVNGLFLVDEHFKALALEHQAEADKATPFDPQSPIPTL